jgi:peptidoglycan/xylan/chitin deacetylase (PgdA/CDA1 family)
VCKDEQILKIIEEKNKELNLDIKIVLENDKEENVKKIPVLMYHGVSDVTWGIANLFMKVSDFENQLKYIHDNYETIFLEDIDKFGSKKEVVLTFDDGYVDFYTNVFPLLKKYNIKANLYVIDNADGGVYLSKSQIKEIAESNLVSIGSHTETHVNLANLDSVQLEYELKESKNNIEKLIGKEVKTICYPLGAYNNKVLEAASKYYDYGLIIENGVQKMYDDYNKLAIRRFRVYRNTGFSSFKNMVDQAN